MKLPYFLLPLCLLLVGCANPAGLTIYQPIKYTRADGSSGTKMQRSMTLAADLSGVQKIQSGETIIDFGESGVFLTSETTRAQGEAVKGITKEVSAGITGAILSGATAAAVGAGATAIPTN